MADPAIAEALREATDALDYAITSNAGRGKAEAFLGLLADEAVACDGLWGVAARSPRTAEQLRVGLGALGFDLPVIPIAAMSFDQEYSGVIVPAWPNDQRFTRLKNLAVAPRIHVLTYPFEKKWLLRHNAREGMRSRANMLPPEGRAAILGLEAGVFGGLDRAETGHIPDLTSLREVQLDLPVFRFEERVAQRRLIQPQIAAANGEELREAQLVRFGGGCYTPLSEWAELPVLNELVDSGKGDKARLFSATAAHLSPGDFVLFRAGGDKEFTRQIAEEITGVEEYQRNPGRGRKLEIRSPSPWQQSRGSSKASGRSRSRSDLRDGCGMARKSQSYRAR